MKLLGSEEKNDSEALLRISALTLN